MTPGLYQELAAGNLGLEKLRACQADTDAAPQVLHCAQVAAGLLQARLVAVELAIHENHEFVREVQGLLNRLHVSKHKALHRSVVITHLEEAQDRLRRELGPEPTP